MSETLTPVREQYLRLKRQYPGAILLFRLGDFSETFDEDARLVAKELEITLTSREMGKGRRFPMAGIPYHALDNYLGRLINNGHKVAICEQVTKPGEFKGLVKRDVVRVVTPGTVLEPGLLDARSNNYLISLVLAGEEAGIAHVDITTGEFAVTQLPLTRLPQELGRLNPSEIVAAEGAELSSLSLKVPVNRIESYWFEPETARETLLRHFGVTTLDGFGLARLPLAVGAAGGVLHYLEETQKGALTELSQLSTYSTDTFMALDGETQQNLEVFRSYAGNASGSLLSVIDLTKTAMGGRLLKRWLGQPLLELEELNERQDRIDWFFQNTLARGEVISLLGSIPDLARLVNRIGGGLANPKEVVALRRGLELVPKLRDALGDAGAVTSLRDRLKPNEAVVALISQALEEDPPANLNEGGVIKAGFSEELGRLRDISKNARQYLAELEFRERQRTGLKSLRVGFNNVFGYYIEVSKSNLSQVPPDYIRKQTLSTGERYYTPELKDYESTILNARERILELEGELFRRVSRQVGDESDSVIALSGAIAELDVFSALAEVAVRYGYTRPELNDGDEIIIKEGRHPVVERSLPPGSFVANDTHLSNADSQIIILTGPNMAGKSTYLKQVALIVLMAQTGSFVPVKTATIGLVDRIFTRIGAREDLVSGQSTFMVEMVETANILNNATVKSLIILDEIGRGTSTYDGLSIARAVSEYIHNRIGAKTIFATHYHEMVELATYLPRVRNFNVAVAEEGGRVIFLRQVKPGGVDKSYGIHVGKLAGLPRAVVHRAEEVLDEFEGDSGRARKRHPGKATSLQLPLLGEKSPLVEELRKLDVEGMTPLEALNRLYELKKKAEGS
ncbi:MAG: DNA mismatch repair protein MutS [Chloroflexota bacterium]